MKLDEFIFKSQNIWNANRNLKFLVMRCLTSTQTLMKYLIKSSTWYVNYKKKKSSDELKFLFFTSNCMQKLLRDHLEILIINVIYKTNRYKMSLLIIIDVIYLSITFYVAFCFIKKKNYNSYLWVMQTLKRLFDHLHLSYSMTTLINEDKTLTFALYIIFNQDVEHRINHDLYIWYLNQNVIVNCKKYFRTNEE